MNSEQIVMRLELIAAKATVLANDLRNGKLWGGDLSRGLGEISAEVSKASDDARTDR